MTSTGETELDHVDHFLEAISEEFPELDLLVEGIVDRINGIARRVRRMMVETLAEYGLSFGEWEVLTSLRHAPDRRLSPGKLATRSELSTGAMTNRLDQLEEQGFVKRMPDEKDRRALVVELTDEGNAIWEASVGVQAQKETLIADALDEREKEQLNALLRRLMRAFEKQELKKASRATDA